MNHLSIIHTGDERYKVRAAPVPGHTHTVLIWSVTFALGKGQPRQSAQ